MLAKLIVLFCLVHYGLAEYGPKKSYEGYKTYNLDIDTQAKLKFVNQFVDLEGYDFWVAPSLGKTTVMVEPKNQANFVRYLTWKKIRYNILHENVGSLIEYESEKPRYAFRSLAIPSSQSSSSLSGTYNYDHVPRFSEILDFMENFGTECRDYVKLVNLGNSSLGRPIMGVEIKKKEDNPVILLDAGMHAREWAAPPAAMYIMEQVIRNAEVFANNFTIVIIPMLNPDGYEFTHMSDRLWRKTLSRQPHSNCFGVDLNRNFDSHWGEYRTDNSVCSPIYGGKEPFSEPESRALRDAMFRYKPTAYVTLHSYGSYILYPWGFTDVKPPNWRHLHRTASRMADRVREFGKTNYKVGNPANLMYKASGASDDWAMEKANVYYVYTIELPNLSGKDDFVVPNDKILDMVTETFEAFLVLINDIYQF